MRSISARIQGTPDSDDAISRAPAALAMGFRPFFLVAAVFAAAVSATWVWALFTGVSPSHLAPTIWHAHEMLFGFTMAVVAGFLLTAARNWTGLDTAHGYPLLALVGLWLAGRLAMVGSWLPPALAAAIVTAFPAALAVVVGRVIVRARRTRNYGIIGILAVMTLASAAVHLDALGAWPGAARPALYGATHLMVLLTVVIGGRIIPLFTRNKTGDDSIRTVPVVDYAAISLAAAVAALGCGHVAGVVDPALFASAAAASGVAQLLRVRTWGTLAALRIPMLAVLHVAYLWIGVGHVLLAVATIGTAIPTSIALHALTLGGIGTMTIGMMARVTLGHTGREIKAPRAVAAAFMCVSAATVARLLAAVLEPEHLRSTWLGAAGFFAAGFLLYAVWAVPALLRARPDGRPG